MNNKGQMSTGFSWIYALVFLFALGILFIVFNQVLQAEIVPTVKGILSDSPNVNSSTKTLINADIDKYMDFFTSLPFIMFIVAVIYMGISAIRREPENRL